MKTFTATLCALALIATGCADENGGTAGSETGAAGEIVTVHEHELLVDDQRAAGGEKLFVGTKLVTDARGEADLRLNEKLDACRSGSTTSLRCWRRPGCSASGRARTCNTANGDRRAVDIPAGQAAIDVRDTVFSVGVSDQETDVRVFWGFAEVRREGLRPGTGVSWAPRPRPRSPPERSCSLPSRCLRRGWTRERRLRRRVCRDQAPPR